MMVSFRQNLRLTREDFALQQERFKVEQMVALLKQAEAGVPPFMATAQSPGRP